VAQLQIIKGVWQQATKC